jgi:hypothetical protein
VINIAVMVAARARNGTYRSTFKNESAEISCSG